jgi:ketosteroid isomerase-like protein
MGSTSVITGNGGTFTYQHKDWAGSVRVNSTGSHTIASDRAFTPYGEEFAHFGGTTKEGTRTLNHLRSTLGFRKISGRWQVVHQHVSVPFDMKNGKALLELEA